MGTDRNEYCPVPGGELDCPYCSHDGICGLANPWEECDDYITYMGVEEEE